MLPGLHSVLQALLYINKFLPGATSASAAFLITHNSVQQPLQLLPTRSALVTNLQNVL